LYKQKAEGWLISSRKSKEKEDPRQKLKTVLELLQKEEKAGTVCKATFHINVSINLC